MGVNFHSALPFVSNLCFLQSESQARGGCRGSQFVWEERDGRPHACNFCCILQCCWASRAASKSWTSFTCWPLAEQRVESCVFFLTSFLVLAVWEGLSDTAELSLTQTSGCWTWSSSCTDLRQRADPLFEEKDQVSLVSICILLLLQGKKARR